MPAERPYIGVTGVSNPAEASRISQAFKESLTPDASHRGMIGILMNRKTLNGKPAENPAKYPSFLSLPEILEATDGATLNAIHYSTTDYAALSDQIEKVFGPSGLYSGELARAIQFNMSWPDPVELGRIRDRFPEMKMVVQLSRRILESLDREEIVERLAPYQGLANYVLIDPSGGKGVPINERRVGPLYRALVDRHPMGIVIAGGMSNRNVREVLVTLTRGLATDEFGIDAEAGLRIPSESENDQLSVDKAISYVRRASSFFDTAEARLRSPSRAL